MFVGYICTRLYDAWSAQYTNSYEFDLFLLMKLVWMQESINIYESKSNQNLSHNFVLCVIEKPINITSTIENK